MIKREAQEISPQLVQIRRQIHMYPELGFQEENTASLISQQLRNIEVKFSRVAGTGISALLEGKRKGRVVALRADMDALPIQEASDKPYRSRVDGVMHACGHDAHVAVVLGTAMILSKFKDALNGSVKFIFQPCEEKNPGGAPRMIGEGVLENPRVDAIFGLHVDPRYEVGKIAYRYGPTMAQADEFEITIVGKGGHGASPHLTVDPIPIAAEVVLALQKIASRMTDPTEPVVVSVGRISGGTATNIIPPEVTLAGTCRTLSPDLAGKFPQLIEDILKGITSAYGAEYRLRYDPGYPVLSNDRKMTDLVKEAALEYLGPEGVLEMERPSLGGEDFAFYLQRVKGSFFRLGTKNPQKGITSFWHTPTFDIDEDALPIGAGFMAYLALRFLGE